MKFFYNFGIALYSFILKVVSPFNSKAHQLTIGRNASLVLLKSGKLPKNAIWIHCASLGEFEQGRPIIEQIKLKYPAEKVIVTFFSPSGYEIRKNYALADAVLYLPSDTAANAKLLVESLEPKMAIFVKYEFWHHYIAQLSKVGIPIYLVSAIFRENQVFFKFHGKWFREILKRVTFFFCQDENSITLLHGIGLTNCVVTGDTRFDRVYEIAHSVKEIPNIDKFIGNQQVLIAGSSWLPDEALIIEYIHNHPGLKLIIAPHEIHRAHILKITQMLKVNFVLFSEQKSDGWAQAQVLVVDTMGLLSSLYQYGTVAYIGGGFGRGIHNTLEAATFGLPILFGPKYEKFKEAVDLIAMQGAYSISNYMELEECLDKLLGDPILYNNSCAVSKNYVESQIGATSKILDAVLK